MPVVALTDRWLKTIKTNKAQEEFSDSTFSEKGVFGVVVSRVGTKRFFHRYRVNGKKRRETLGTYPSMSLAEARRKAVSNVVTLTEGDDPAAVRDAYRNIESFGSLVALFFERNKDNLAAGTIRNYRSIYARDLQDRWANRKATDIKKADVIAVLEHICYDREAPFKSNRTFEFIRRIFNFAIARDIVENNPVRGFAKLAKEQPLERVFTQEEMKAFWAASENQLPHIRAIFRLLLLTGQRPGEIKRMEWAHIDKDILTIPAANSKNRRRHQIHLSATALKEIDQMRALTGTRQYVFAVRDTDKSIEGLTKGYWGMMEAMELTIAGAEVKQKKPKPKSRPKPKTKHIPHWTVRDIRRTVQTRMAEMGIRPDVVDRVLNHNVPGVRKHYDHYSYYPEIRNALIRWEQRLNEIVAGKQEQKVVNIR